MSFVGGRGGDRFHSDRDQEADIRRAVAAMGATVDMLPAELDVSGGLPLEQRPSLLAAIEGVEAGRYAGIVVAYLSRLGRSVREQLRAWDRVETAGGRIVVVREGIDTSTPAGRMHRTILLAIAENERELHVERFEGDRERATAAGIWQRRQVPRGYAKDPMTRRLVPGPDAALVVSTFADRLSGTPVIALAERLGMTTSGVRALLRNRVYLGELTVGKHSNPDAHPAIVDRDLFDAVNAGNVARPARANPQVALLGGLVRCQACGHRMSRGRSGSVPVYGCHRLHSGGVCPAPAAVSCHLLDDLVGRIARAQLASAEAARAAIGERDSALAALRADVARDEAEFADYIDAVSASDVGPEAFGRGARKRRQAVDDSRAALRRAIALRPVPGGEVAMVQAWDQMNTAERRTVLGSMLEAVIVASAGGRGSRRPLEDRVRVIAAGAGLPLPVKRGHKPMGIVALPWPEHDGDIVLGIPGLDDSSDREHGSM